HCVRGGRVRDDRWTAGPEFVEGNRRGAVRAVIDILEPAHIWSRGLPDDDLKLRLAAGVRVTEHLRWRLADNVIAGGRGHDRAGVAVAQEDVQVRRHAVGGVERLVPLQAENNRLVCRDGDALPGVSSATGVEVVVVLRRAGDTADGGTDEVNAG